MKPSTEIRRLKSEWLRAIGLSLLVLGLSVSVARATGEYQIKAAFLYNFAKFVDWPPPSFKNDSAPFVIGVVGEDPFGDALSVLVQHEQVKGRPIEIRRFRPGEDFTGCHLLFVSRSESRRFNELLPAAEKANILTVGEDPAFLPQGGMINFALVNKTVRFDINKNALTKAGLKMSSKLLAVARTVQDQP